MISFRYRQVYLLLLNFVSFFFSQDQTSYAKRVLKGVAFRSVRCADEGGLSLEGFEPSIFSLSARRFTKLSYRLFLHSVRFLWLVMGFAHYLRPLPQTLRVRNQRFQKPHSLVRSPILRPPEGGTHCSLCGP